jgi:UDP-2-acetamido-3-amino-2,3-dideoxy-glucuronate N-acetyltransferase
MSQVFTAHETAIIDPGAVVGAGTRIWHWTHIHKAAIIGANCSLGQNVYVGKAVIGNNVKIQNNVSVYDSVVIEDDVFCGPSMVFTNVINPRSHVTRKHEYKQTLVRKGATIGANAVILCGHTIGEFAMIGAGSVVTKDIPSYAIVAGNPAKQIGWMCQCGIRLKPRGSQATCDACGSCYSVDGGICAAVGDVRVL